MHPFLFANSGAPRRLNHGEPRIAQVRASDGYPLAWRQWPVRGPRPRGCLVLLHGIQSHGGWYSYSCSRLAAAGYEVRLLDRRGSGLNARQRGHAPHEDRLIHDVVQALGQARHALPLGTPIILGGVSWGGKLALAVALRRPKLIDGLALLYPGLTPRIQPTRLQRLLLEWGCAAGLPPASILIPLNEPELFTDEPNWQDFIRQDALALRRVSTHFLQANLKLSADIAREARPLGKPLLLLLAGRDRIIDTPRTRLLFERLRDEHAQLVEYPDACHTLEFEPDPEPFIENLRDWLSRIPRP